MFNHYICIVLSTYQDFKQTSGSLHLNLIIFQALYGPLTKTSDRHVPVMTILKTSSSEKDIFYNICIHLVPIIILSRKHRRPKKTFFTTFESTLKTSSCEKDIFQISSPGNFSEFSIFYHELCCCNARWGGLTNS